MRKHHDGGDERTVRTAGTPVCAPAALAAVRDQRDHVVQPMSAEQGCGQTARERLTSEDREWIKQTAGRLGPLDGEDREYLAMVFAIRRR
ncbi:hypothetical protein [Rhizohabitans arisaemae]|uniref:hypothetical protein n=1 Tax=Rhizohabitans arisaemae TaxID=2720610 RepID=UPI0024B1ABC1|nr:hypothetical protein [Rhizohabitans arisaemae]